MFNKKARRNFRQRKDESSEDENENEYGGNNEKDTSVDNSKQSSVPRRGISCSSKPTPPRQPIKSDSSGTEDSEEPVSCNLQANRSNVSSKNNPLSFLDEKDGIGVCDFQLKRSTNKAVVFLSRKKEKSPVKQICSGAKEVDLNEHSNSSVGSSAENMRPDSDSETSSTTSSSSSFKAQSANIPDAKIIHAAKEQRRRARAQRDYIPLERDEESTLESGVGGEDQSDGECDSHDEPDDHERRIEFAPKPKTLREQMAEKMGGSEDDCSDSQEEDHHLWEEQQIGKGVKRHQMQSRGDFKPLRQKKIHTFPETLPSVSIDIIKKRIIGKLDSLKEVHRAREAELRRMQLDMEDAQSCLASLENHSADQQLNFYRRMSTFSQNLLECLAEKMPSINLVELDMHSLYIDQAEALLSQRREVVQEESARLQRLTYSADTNSNRGALGNTERSKDGEVLEEDCGSVPADLEPAVEQDAELKHKRGEILKRSQEIFADVQEDFSDVEKILNRFDEWRYSFPESYTNAYISLCLPKLLAPLIRHQLIGWNPLKAEGEDFEVLPWYSAVEKFCYGQGYEECDNADQKTLTAIIEKTVLPKIQGFVELVWDPFSSQQSRCLTSLCKRIQEDYSVFGGEQSKPVKAFIEAVIHKLRSAVDNDVFIPLYPKTYLDDELSPQFQFRNQQFWSAVKLLGNMALWDGLVAQDILKDLILDKLLNRYLMMCLLNESNPKYIIQKYKKVADYFPKSWFLNLTTGSSLPQLQNFSKHLMQTAHLLSKENEDSTSLRPFLSDVMTLLSAINALENVNVIAEKYNCQDLLGAVQKE